MTTTAATAMTSTANAFHTPTPASAPSLADVFARAVPITLSDSVRRIVHGSTGGSSNSKDRVRAVAIALAGIAAAAGLFIVGRRMQRRVAQAEKAAAEARTVTPAFHRLLACRSPPRTRPSGERLLAPPANQTILQVALTGGPMGGKASLAGRLCSALGERGWRVIAAPSVTAILLNSGAALPDFGDSRAMLEFEGAVLGLQVALEDAFKRAASAASSGDQRGCVIVYDRGVLDVAAFVPREQWPALADMAPRPRPMDWYAAVCHLVTAADGAEGAFEAHVRRNGGNKNAKAAVDAEVAEALRIDAVCAEVQGGHPGYVRIDNSTDFQAKLDRAVAAVVERVEAAADEAKRVKW